MHILLTGGAGFIGSHLTRRLLSLGHHVDVVDNLSTGRRDNLPPGVTLLELDISARDFLSRLPDDSYDAIVHLAGQSAGEKSFDDPLYDFDANARSTLVLAEWGRAHGVEHFIYASSMGIYGQPQTLPIREDCVPIPLSYYGHSKLAAEVVLELQQRLGMRVVLMRMFSVYGPGQNLDDLRQGMVSIFLAHLLRALPLVVKGSLERSRDLVYIDDVVDAWVRALTMDVSGPFNIGTGVATTVGQLIERLRARVGGGEPTRGPDTPGDQTHACADITRAREVLGWEPQVTLEEGLDRMVLWAKP